MGEQYTRVEVTTDDNVLWQVLSEAEGLASAHSGGRSISPATAVGFVPVNPQMVFSGIWASIGDELSQIAKLHGTDAASIAKQFELTDLVGQKPQDLSGGEAIRAAVALVYASKPSVWVLDRCFEWLEPRHRGSLSHFFLSELQRGASIFELSSGRRWFIEADASPNTSKSQTVVRRDDRRPAEPSQPILELNNVSAMLSPRFTLGPISLKIRAGERVALVGPNGAGKTTLAKIAAGLLAHTGKVLVAGTQPERRRAWAQHVVYAFQNPDDQIFRASVRQELSETARRAGRFESHRLRNIAEIMGLLNHLRLNPLDLALSNRRLVTAGAALVPRIRLAILDEPTAFLSANQLQSLIRATEFFVNSGGAVISITHDPEFASQFATRTISIDRGQVVDDTRP